MKLLCTKSVQMIGNLEKEQYQAFTEGKEYQARKGTVKGLDGDPYSVSTVLRAKNDKGESHIIRRLENDKLNDFFTLHFKEITK